MALKRNIFPKKTIDILHQLIAGNKRFIEDACIADLSAARRKELLKGQKPVATVLTCSDSRVMPGYIFDQGLGNLFIVRTAGQILDDICLASLEYGVLYLKTPLLIVLGHTYCGAIDASVSKLKVDGHLPILIEKINSIVYTFKEVSCSKDFCDKISKENVLKIAKTLPSMSKSIEESVNAETTTILPAMYDMETGKVDFLTDISSLNN